MFDQMDQERSLYGEVANVLDCDIVVCEFEIQSIMFTFGLISLVLVSERL